MKNIKETYSGFMAVCPTDNKPYPQSFSFDEEGVKTMFSILTRSMYQWKDYEAKGWHIEPVELTIKIKH